jgi:hypothetical protein
MSVESLGEPEIDAVPWRLSLPLDNPVRVQALRSKLVEYEERMRRHFRHIAPDSPGFYLAWSKKIILSIVLDEGDVYSKHIFNELSTHPGYTPQYTEAAIIIINDYCENGGRNLTYGTGLREGTPSTTPSWLGEGFQPPAE